MKQIVEILAVLSVGTLVGAEFAVAAFLRPILASLPGEAFRTARGVGARMLGRVMPFWYLGSLALLVAAAAVGSQRWLVGTGVGLMAVVALISVTMLVPINNRIAAGEASPALVTRWDRLHWVRVMLLAVIFVLLVIGVLR